MLLEAAVVFALGNGLWIVGLYFFASFVLYSGLLRWGERDSHW